MITGSRKLFTSCYHSRKELEHQFIKSLSSRKFIAQQPLYNLFTESIRNSTHLCGLFHLEETITIDMSGIWIFRYRIVHRNNDVRTVMTIQESPRRRIGRAAGTLRLRNLIRRSEKLPDSSYDLLLRFRGHG